ncbi:hypothetical protein B0H13DRAFT_2373260 [Mycena leptocephala]|nr:hypothetical protein B0H13DRAFT_2373260 [Mycena leptocephala]
MFNNESLDVWTKANSGPAILVGVYAGEDRRFRLNMYEELFRKEGLRARVAIEVYMKATSVWKTWDRKAAIPVFQRDEVVALRVAGLSTLEEWNEFEPYIFKPVFFKKITQGCSTKKAFCIMGPPSPLDVVSIYDSGAQQIGGVAGRIPIHPDPPPASPQESAPTHATSDKQRTQNGQLFDDYGEGFDILGDLMLEHESDPEITAGSKGIPLKRLLKFTPGGIKFIDSRINAGDIALLSAEPWWGMGQKMGGVPSVHKCYYYNGIPLAGSICSCGSKEVEIQCHDCTGYKATCTKCFIAQHLNNPFHWAEKWDLADGFFVKHDISSLGHIIQLGHHGGPCASPVGTRKFTVVDHNGVHATQLAFCGCRELPPNKVRQLMRSRLFPATMKETKTAFTFTLLKQCHLHNLEAKKAAYDYMGALRRLTNNSFTADVPDPYANFLRSIRVWNYLTLHKRSGQMHGIDCLLPHRLEGNLVLYCPACPEPGFNSDPMSAKTPESLRHLNQSQRTLDGNFRCNQYSENSDPDDVSLCNGKGQFLLDTEYKTYLDGIPVSTEKSTCNCVDLQLGESDYALAMALRQHNGRGPMSFEFRMEVDDVDEVTTYDIACEYTIYAEQRFQQHFPDVAEKVKKMRWGVPALHVQGHQDSCIYMFGTAYLSCIGHFHGKTAEQYWPEANQLGPHVRQMNNGHRQDTMIDHQNDWNYQKLADLGPTLAAELAVGKRKFLEKLSHFRGLSAAAGELVEKWKLADRTPRKAGKDVVSVYRHNTSKVLSQLAIYQHMLAQDDTLAGSMVPKNRVARFLNEALMIQEDQRKIIRTVKEAKEQDLQSLLEARLGPWRRVQREVMPTIGDKVAAQSRMSPPRQIEDEILYLPSDLTAAERRELELREGQAFDALRATRTIVKAIRALSDRKEKHDRKQKQNSRAGNHIRDALCRRDFRMAIYELARQALISLDHLSAGPDSAFPPLSVAGTFMKSVVKKRQLGDSRSTMGDSSLWEVDPQTCQTLQQPQWLYRLRNHRATETSQKAEERKEGWLWRDLGRMGKLTDEEMDAWSQEADRVQWFRAEAEVQRWQEHVEMRLAELLRTIRSFRKWDEVWLSLAEQQEKPGHAEYAKQKAHIYVGVLPDVANVGDTAVQSPWQWYTYFQDGWRPAAFETNHPQFGGQVKLDLDCEWKSRRTISNVKLKASVHDRISENHLQLPGPMVGGSRKRVCQTVAEENSAHEAVLGQTGLTTGQQDSSAANDAISHAAVFHSTSLTTSPQDCIDAGDLVHSYHDNRRTCASRFTSNCCSFHRHAPSVGVKRPDSSSGGQPVSIFDDSFETAVPTSIIHHYEGTTLPFCSFVTHSYILHNRHLALGKDPPARMTKDLIRRLQFDVAPQMCVLPLPLVLFPIINQHDTSSAPDASPFDAGLQEFDVTLADASSSSASTSGKSPEVYTIKLTRVAEINPEGPLRLCLELIGKNDPNALSPKRGFPNREGLRL